MGAGLLAGCDQSGMDGPETMTYTAPLSALNNSGVSGQAVLPVRGDQSSVGTPRLRQQSLVVPHCRSRHERRRTHFRERMTVDSSYQATLPVACGTLSRQ